jgi:hypothetical protein
MAPILCESNGGSVKRSWKKRSHRRIEERMEEYGENIGKM